ncbi:hypothetical protein K5E40_34185 [Pseudomonas baetica]|uniref:hypothetical protein n=1 Tax=Pseudomonas TaxID=286 RepID=UPI001C8BC5C1|nr:hypothetical protein [Pseudomonas baetica]MBX9410669.1 hypothetical protein [Pseudomonas baetica]
MISNIKVTIGINDKKQEVELICDDTKVSITLNLENQSSQTYTDRDFYKCFGLLRKSNPHIRFFCKGSKINVHPSSMSSQMSLGLKAYELVMGKKPSLEEVVFIFDYEEENLTNDPEEQRTFYLNWITS